MKSLVIVLAMTLCLAFSAVAEEGTDVTPSPGDLVTPSPQDDEVMKKTLRQAREERRRKVVIASYCQPVIQKLKRSETNETGTSLTMDNCRVTGFAGGDFLTLRQGLQAVTGVADVQLGYMGGWKRSPTYREVCLGGTGHTEMVIVAFNKEETNYTTLLDVFFRSHNSRSRVQKGDFAGIQFKSMVYLLDHPQLWEFAQMKKKLDAMPEYKQDSLWVLTEPTALKERPNNFFPEFGSEDSLLEIRVQTREKVESKLTKVRDNLDKIAKEAEKDLENLKKENATGPIILVEKDVGEDQAAKYAKASDSEKKKIESERDEMMKTAAAKARTLRRKLEDDLKIEELRQKNIARRAKIAAEMEAEAKVKAEAQKEGAEKKDAPVEKKEEKKEDSPVEKKEEKKEDPPVEKKEDAPAKVEKKKEDGSSEKKEKQEETPAKKEDAPVEKKEDKKEDAPVEKKVEKKEDSPAEKKEEKKEEPTEKKDTAPVEKKEDPPAEKKEAKKEDPPAEKKDDAPVAKKEEGEKKEETPAKKEDAPVEKKEDKKEDAPVEKKEEKKEDSPAEKKEEKKEEPIEKKDNAPVEKKEDPPAEKKDVPVEKKEESPVKKEDSAEPEKRQAEAPAKEKAEDPAPVKTES